MVVNDLEIPQDFQKVIITSEQKAKVIKDLFNQVEEGELDLDFFLEALRSIKYYLGA